MVDGVCLESLGQADGEVEIGSGHSGGVHGEADGGAGLEIPSCAVGIEGRGLDGRGGAVDHGVNILRGANEEAAPLFLLKGVGASLSGVGGGGDGVAVGCLGGLEAGALRVDGVAVVAGLQTEYLVVGSIGCLSVETQGGVRCEVGGGTEAVIGRADVIDGVVGVEGYDVGILDSLDEALRVSGQIVVGLLQSGAGVFAGEAAYYSHGGADHLAEILAIVLDLALGHYEGHEAVAQLGGLTLLIVVIDIELAIGGGVADGGGSAGGAYSYRLGAGGEIVSLAVGSHGEALGLGGEQSAGVEVEELVSSYII